MALCSLQTRCYEEVRLPTSGVFKAEYFQGKNMWQKNDFAALHLHSHIQLLLTNFETRKPPTTHRFICCSPFISKLEPKGTYGSDHYPSALVPTDATCIPQYPPGSGDDGGPWTPERCPLLGLGPEYVPLCLHL